MITDFRLPSSRSSFNEDPDLSRWTPATNSASRVHTQATAAKMDSPFGNGAGVVMGVPGASWQLQDLRFISHASNSDRRKNTRRCACGLLLTDNRVSGPDRS